MKARWHIFNKMPIRMLAFDSTGSNIKLIGRNDIFSQVLPNIFAEIIKPQFQLDWEETSELSDWSWNMTERQDRRDELLEAAIRNCARYAILSHTWMRDLPGDVVFQDWDAREENAKGNRKIDMFCEVAAREHGVTFGWMDTICINKESSSELDESIRSMYNWYRGAFVCVIILAETNQIKDGHRDSWFTRGWTLQELLAPTRSWFYNTNWNVLGHNKSKQVKSLIYKATGITRTELGIFRTGTEESVGFSRRLQMAANRQVTREEDAAYSLMGILGVSINIAYGEGAQSSFRRVIKEVIATKPRILDLLNRGYKLRDSLVPSDIKQYLHRHPGFDKNGALLDLFSPAKPILVTHVGLRISLLIAPGLSVSATELYKPFVPCGDYSAQHEVTMHSPSETFTVCYNILDKRLFTEPVESFPHIIPEGSAVDTDHRIKNYGIFNFGSDGNTINLPDICCAVQLWCDRGDHAAIIESPSDPADTIYLAGSRPAFLTLQTDPQKDTIPKANLEKHGMRLLTMYL